MKNLYLLLVLFCCLNCDNSDNKNEPRIDLEFYDSLIFDGAERTYFVHLPVNYNDTKKYPLIFAMHGGGVLGYEGVMGQSELSELSDDENFIVVYPEGIRTLGLELGMLETVVHRLLY